LAIGVESIGKRRHTAESVCFSDDATREKRQLFGASVAMKAGDPDAAYTFLDGPDGAGIGWTLQRNDIRDKLGLPPEHDEFA